MPEETFTLCDCFIPGRPVPWKAPTVVRGKAGKKGHAFKDEFLVAWQEMVALHAGANKLCSEPTTQWVMISLLFILTPASKTKDPKWQKPDIGNIEKAVEDALQGVLYVNDNQIMRRGYSGVQLCRDPNRQGVRIVARTMPEEDVWIG